MPTLLLALETATDACSVALLDGARVEATTTLLRPRMHAERLVPVVHDLLGATGYAPADLGAVAVSMGPGSYTGLRIGVSTAKGLVLATGAALVGVSTLEAMAASLTPFAREGDVLLPAIDARRDEVYAAAYQHDEGGALTALRDPVAHAVDALPGWLNGVPARCWLTGSGAAKASAALRAAGHHVRTLLPASHPASAAWVGRLGARRLQQGATEDVAAFEPFYLKAFVATPRKGSAFDRLP